jgi:hypothetical protein
MVGPMPIEEVDAVVRDLIDESSTWEMSSPQGAMAMADCVREIMVKHGYIATLQIASRMGCYAHPAMTLSRLAGAIVQALTTLQECADILNRAA